MQVPNMTQSGSGRKLVRRHNERSDLDEPLAGTPCFITLYISHSYHNACYERVRGNHEVGIHSSISQHVDIPVVRRLEQHPELQNFHILAQRVS